jgi:catechol 2,3-dioxygenase-like lactoylglutathione lyase family enzyme
MLRPVLVVPLQDRSVRGLGAQGIEALVGVEGFRGQERALTGRSLRHGTAVFSPDSTGRPTLYYRDARRKAMAIVGAHVLLYSSEPEKLRAVLRDVFGFRHVDAGDGWLIFALPPAEVGVHPAEEEEEHDHDHDECEGHAMPHALSFMCDDIQATIRELRAKGVAVRGEPEDHGYGIVVMLDLPGGVEVQLYQPRHASPIL